MRTFDLSELASNKRQKRHTHGGERRVCDGMKVDGSSSGKSSFPRAEETAAAQVLD